MCGHGIIGLTTVVLETGMVSRKGNHPVLKIDTPAGRVTATAVMENHRVTSVAFQNVPSFVYKKNLQVDVEGIGTVHFDIAFGGAFYAFCRAKELGVKLVPSDHSRLIDIGRRIKQAIVKNHDIRHPFEKDLGFLYGIIFMGPAKDPCHHSRNVCVFAEGEVDRPPTGTGVSARAALHYDRRELEIGQTITIESILGTCFDVSIIETVPFGGFEAIIPEVTGSAFIVGENRFYFAPDDPLKNGFIFR